MICGLGNPGEKYKNTPHNIGFQVVDEFALKRGLKLKAKRFGGIYDSVKFSGKEDGGSGLIHLFKPLTYMNASGVAVATSLNFFSLAVENLIVVHDDADLHFGRIDIKKGGGSGGHRGVESIAEELDSKDFTRIRMGIGRKLERTLSDHVLSPYDPQQKKVLAEFLSLGADAIETILLEGIGVAMNRFNGDRNRFGNSSCAENKK